MTSQRFVRRGVLMLAVATGGWFLAHSTAGADEPTAELAETPNTTFGWAIFGEATFGGSGATSTTTFTIAPLTTPTPQP